MSVQNDPWNSLQFMTETSIEVDDGQLRLMRNRPGEAPRLLLLHGVLRDWRSFYSILPALQPDCSIAALDFRGHGGSTVRGPYLVVDYVNDVLQVLRQLAEPCVIYGHSLGAMVALAAASAQPDRVAGLVLEDPPFSTMGANLRSLPMQRYFEGVQDCLLQRQSTDLESLYQAFSNIVVGTSPDGRPILVSEQRDETSRRFSAACLARVDPKVLQPITAGCWLEGYDLIEMLKHVGCPVEVLQADWSWGGMLTDREAQLISEKLADRCQLRFFQATGHSIHWAQPDEVVACIRARVCRA